LAAGALLPSGLEDVRAGGTHDRLVLLASEGLRLRLALARSDLAAGIQRLTYAGLIIFSAGLGAWMVVAVSGVSPATAPAPAIGLAGLDALRLVAGFAGVFGFAVGFNTPWRFAVAAACIGSVANTARLTAIGWHLPQQFAAAGATFVVGVAAFFASRYVRSPRSIL
jgi:Threonine/Serine exporter, ThrE